MHYLDIDEMIRRQIDLRNLYEPLWGPLHPELGLNTLLWTYGEMGEVGDIITLDGDDAIMNDPKIRKHFVEEFCDVLMYLNDILICYNITSADVTEKYHRRIGGGDNTVPLDIGEMLEHQKNLPREVPLKPEAGVRAALCANNVMCRLNDYIKKMGHEAILNDAVVRDDFVDDFCDVLMHLNDILVCYNITPEEVTKEYREKNDYNMVRWVDELPEKK